MKPGTLPPINKRSYICHYCGLHHKNVEAGGVHHCPNPCCLGPGQSYARSKLKSYEDIGNGKHTVDLEELFDKGLRKALELNDRTIATQAFITVASECLREAWR
jgi:hypothetical protein